MIHFFKDKFNNSCKHIITNVHNNDEFVGLFHFYFSPMFSICKISLYFSAITSWRLQIPLSLTFTKILRYLDINTDLVLMAPILPGEKYKQVSK